MKPTIIFEDDDVLVINKPSGLVVHGDGRTKEATLADWVLETYPAMRDVGETGRAQDGEVILRPGIVHRLDRETSGVMILAKTQAAFEFLKVQFKERTAEKTYRAFVYGQPKEDEGEIDRPIGKSASDFRKYSAQRGARGVLRKAHTLWKVLVRFEEDGEKYTYMELSPKTGRTHQLRVHLKAINLPIVCDELYAPKHECALGFARTALHAHTLTLTLPSGKLTTFEAPLPDDFMHAIDFCGK